jgi:hypothetical protein
MKGIFDTPDDVTGKLDALKTAGIHGIIRYDDPSGNPNSWKQIGTPEYQAILARGIAVGIVSEWANDHVGYFSGAAGQRDGAYSLQRATQRNQPKGSAIYAAVDFDAQPSDMTAISAFFSAFSSILRHAGYRVGCYGSGYCCTTLKTHGLIDLRWITCSSGFLGSRDAINNGQYDLWQVFGLCDQSYMGLSADWDTSLTDDWGQVTAGPQPPPVPTYDAQWLQAELNKLGASPPLTVDGVIGPASIQAMIAYVRKTEPKSVKKRR